MNRIINLLLMLIAVLLLKSCGEADQIIYDGEVFLSFTNGTVGEYSIPENNAPFLVQVGIPFPQNSDLTADIKIVYSTAKKGTHYDLPSSVTIPAGSVIADIRVEGNYENMAGRRDTLIIELDSDVAANFNNVYALILEVYCPSDPSLIIGTYDCISNGISTDTVIPTPEAVNLSYVVTISETDKEGYYEISDFSGGCYAYWYTYYNITEDLPGIIHDKCGVYQYVETFDPWGAEQYALVTVNGDGTIFIDGINYWGDTWTMELTKQQ